MKYIANYPTPGTGGAGGAAIQGSGTYIQSSGTVQFSNSNGVTFGLSNNGVMTASVAPSGGAQTGISGLSGGTTQMTSGTAVFSNSNGISFGVNGNTITASYNSTQFQTTGNYLTTAMASNKGSDFMGTNTALTANGVSMTANSSGLSLNFPAFLTTAQPVGAYLTTAALSQDSSKYAGINGAITGGSITVNTSGVSINLPAYLTTAMVSNAVSNFVGVTTVSGTNVSGTFASNGISLSAAAAGGAGVAVSAGGSNFTSGTVTFGNTNGVSFITTNGSVALSFSTAPAGSLFFGSSNGVTFGTSVAGASTTVTASVGAGAGAAVKGSGTYTQNSGTIEFANSNGITFGLSNNGTMTASHNGLTTAMASNAGSLFLNTGTTGATNASITLQSNGLSISVGNYITTARASTDAVGLNTALTAGPLAWTVNSSGISLNAASAAGTTSGFGGNLISGSMTHNTAGLNLSLNHPAWLTTAMQSNAATISNINVSGGTTSSNLSALNFVNSNGVSWSLDTASKIYATVATNYQSQGAYLTTAMASNRGSDFMGTNTALTANGVSMTANSSGLSLNFPVFLTTAQPVGAYLTTARASNDAIGLNTAQSNVTWTVNSSGLSIDARGYAGTGTTFGGTNVSATIGLNSNGLNMSLSAPSAAAGNVTFSAGTTSSGLGAVTFSNSNGVSFGLGTGASAGVITASVNAGGVAMKGSGTYTQNTGTVEFANSNGITFGLSNNGTMTASHNGLTTAMASDAGSQWVYTSAGKNLTNISATFNSNSISLSVGNYITTAMLSNAATISNINVSGGTTSSNMSGINFVNSNGVSWSLDTASKVYATVKTDYQSSNANYLTSQSNQAFSASGGSTTFQTLNFANSNGITFSNSNGSVIASHNGLTTAMASNAGSNFVGVTTVSGTNVSGTFASNGISLSAAAGGAGVAISASNSAFTSGTVSFNQSGALTIGTGAQAINFSVPATSSIVGVGQITISTSGSTISISGATVGNPIFSAGTTSNNLGSIVFSNSNGVSFGLSGSTITASAVGGGAGVAVSAGGSNFTSGTVTFGNTNGVSFITTNGSVALSFSTAPAGSLFFGSSNGVSFGTSTAGASTTVTAITVPGTYGSTFIPGHDDYAPNRQYSSSSFGQNTIYIYEAEFDNAISGSILRIPMFITNSSSAVSSGQKGQTIRLGIYTTNATNATVLTLWQSTSYTIGASYSSNVSWAQSMITGVGNTTSYNTLTASSAGLNLSASLHGQRDILIPVTATFTAGTYWFAFHHSTSGAGTVGNVLNINQAVNTWATFNRIGLSTNVTGSGLLQDLGIGSYSTTTGGFPNGISATQINQFGLAPIFYIGNETA